MSARTEVLVAVALAAAAVLFLVVDREGGESDTPHPEAPADAGVGERPVTPPPVPEGEVPEQEPASAESDPTPEPEPTLEVPVERPAGVSVSGWLQGSGGEFLSAGEVRLASLLVPGTRQTGAVGEDGAFRIDGLVPGAYQIEVRLGGQDLAPGKDGIQVGPEGFRGIEIRLPGRSSISGKIAGAPGPHSPPLQVRRLREGEWIWAGSYRTEPDGSFAFAHLAAARYRLRAEGQGGRTKRCELELRDGEELEDVVLEWAQGQEVVLVLRDEGGAPCRDPVRIICMPQGGALRIIPGRPDENGRIVLDPLPPGKHTLTLMRTGNTSAARVELEVKSGEGLEVPVRFE